MSCERIVRDCISQNEILLKNKDNHYNAIIKNKDKYIKVLIEEIEELKREKEYLRGRCESFEVIINKIENIARENIFQHLLDKK